MVSKIRWAVLALFTFMTHCTVRADYYVCDASNGTNGRLRESFTCQDQSFCCRLPDDSRTCCYRPRYQCCGRLVRDTSQASVAPLIIPIVVLGTLVAGFAYCFYRYRRQRKRPEQSIAASNMTIASVTTGTTGVSLAPSASTEDTDRRPSYVAEGVPPLSRRSQRANSNEHPPPYGVAMLMARKISRRANNMDREPDTPIPRSDPIGMRLAERDVLSRGMSTPRTSESDSCV